VLDHVLGYIRRRWLVAHVPYRSKIPDGGREWQKKVIRDEVTARERFNGTGRHNAGVLLGDGESGIADADLDCPEAIAVGGYFLPETGCMFGRESARMAHRIYASADAAGLVGKATLKFADPDPPLGPDGKRGKDTLLELRVGGGGKAAQTIFPGSVHESGEPIRFEPGFDGDPAEVSGAELIAACKRAAAASLVARAWPSDGGHQWALVIGGFLARAGWDEPNVGLFVEAVQAHVGSAHVKDHVRTAREVAAGLAAGKPTYGFPELKEIIGEKRAKRIADWLDYDARAERREAPAGQSPGRPASRRRAAVQATEDSIALEFANRHADDLRYCHSWGQWLQWTGSHWKRDERRLAFHFARELAREANIAGVPGPAKASTAAGVERFAQADPRLATVSEEWDSDNWLLGTPGGTVDLRTGILRPAERSDHITKVTAVAPAPAGTPTPVWDAFLREATRGDAELIAYLQRLAGYALTGDISEHALGFLYGDGGNGKGVFLNALTKLWGDYAAVASMDVFTASKSDRHPTDLAFLRGARLVTAQETEEGRAWNDVRIKAMTGGDRITARYMRQNNFTYDPTFKILIAGNHKPSIRTVDDAMRRRLNILPFTNKPANPDRKLPDRIEAEGPGILRWCIDGCLAWQRDGLNPPETVLAATNTYFAEQDVFGRWIEESCDVGPHKAGTHAELYGAWKSWAANNGEDAGSGKAFTARLLKANASFRSVTHTPGARGKRGFAGISLKPVDTSTQWQNRGEGF
jgi:P4 family phage/plasmid primase-like protien